MGKALTLLDTYLMTQQSIESNNSTNNSTHFINEGDQVLQAIGQSLSQSAQYLAESGKQVSKDAVRGIADFAMKSLKLGLGAMVKPEEFQEYAKEVISSTVQQARQKVEEGANYVLQHGREDIQTLGKTIKDQAQQDLEYLKAELKFPFDLARKGLTNKALDLQNELNIGEAVQLGTAKIIEKAPVHKAYIGKLYKEALGEITQSISADVQALDASHQQGSMSRENYIEKRIEIQEQFASSISKLRADVSEVVEGLTHRVEGNRLKFEQAARGKEYSEQDGRSFEPGDYQRFIDTAWIAARSRQTYDIPDMVRAIAGY